jgi:signal peptidase I
MNDTSEKAGGAPSVWRRIVVGRNPRATILRAAVTSLVCLLVFGFALKPVRVEGSSMLPRYRDGAINMLNRLAYVISEPRRGDVVCVKTTGLRHMYMKRVVGLPGERIAIWNGQVFINGQPLQEPYVRERADWNRAEEQLGPHEYAVIGDNRGMDQRLHSWGVVAREKIAGKVLW